MAGPGAAEAPPRTVALDPMLAGKKLAQTTFRSTVIAALRQPVTSTKQGIAVFLHRPKELVVANLPADFSVAVVAIPETPGTPEFERLLDDKGFPKCENGTLKWLVDGPGFFPELDRQIAAAQRSIHVQVYIFDNDDIAVRYADKLRQRSADVKVRVIYDDFGSATARLSPPKTPAPEGFTPPSNMKNYLESDSAVKVRRTLNPWLVADHTKLLLFDDRVAIIGGMNIGREYYSEWHDLMVRIEGPVVARLASHFDHAWKMTGPFGDLALLAPRKNFEKPPKVGEGIPIRVLRTKPGLGMHEIRDAMLLALRGAKRRVYIQTPYFAHNEIAVAVRAAAMRGVDVRVVIPAEGDSAIMDAGNLGTAGMLIQAGAKLYRYPRMTHMKVMVCDDWATVGSANLDTLSMLINRELNIAFSDKPEVERLVDTVFTPDFARSARISLKETQTLGAVLGGFIADQL
ncbi:MAG: phospholipase D-like domain-containing protein [Luteolibacter sp.]